MRIWRKRQFKHWLVDVVEKTIWNPEHGYEIDLESCTSSAQILDWIFQILQKDWITEESMAELLLQIQIVLNPQSNFCSWGDELGPFTDGDLQELLAVSFKENDLRFKGIEG